jgi:hypothetical protein
MLFMFRPILFSNMIVVLDDAVPVSCEHKEYTHSPDQPRHSRSHSPLCSADHCPADTTALVRKSYGVSCMRA